MTSSIVTSSPSLILCKLHERPTTLHSSPLIHDRGLSRNDKYMYPSLSASVLPMYPLGGIPLLLGGGLGLNILPMFLHPLVISPDSKTLNAYWNPGMSPPSCTFTVIESFLMSYKNSNVPSMSS